MRQKFESYTKRISIFLWRASASLRRVFKEKLLFSGFSSREIGDKLFISPRTADKHRTNVIQKLQVKNIADLVHYCMKHNLLE